jgi:hypothetical protein
LFHTPEEGSIAMEGETADIQYLGTKIAGVTFSAIWFVVLDTLFPWCQRDRARGALEIIPLAVVANIGCSMEQGITCLETQFVPITSESLQAF